jgi:8-oxo-dGTP diphosphatase
MRKRVRVVAAMIELDGRYLITQRRPEARLPLLWEFPGGKVEEGESDEAALARELLEEMEIEVRVQERAMGTLHAYESYDIDFNVYKCTLVSGTIQHKRVHDHRWVRVAELDHYEFPPPDEKTLAVLLELTH